MERIYTRFPRERRARQAVTGREKIGILFCSRRAWRARRARRLAWISCAAVSCRVSRSRHPVERSSWATTTADRHIHRLAASARHADRARASARQPASLPARCAPARCSPTPASPAVVVGRADSRQSSPKPYQRSAACRALGCSARTPAPSWQRPNDGLESGAFPCNLTRTHRDYTRVLE